MRKGFTVLCYFEIGGSDVSGEVSFVYLVSSISTRKHGSFVWIDNFKEANTLFVCKSLPKHNWLNNADCYLTPKQKNDIQS
jgi:hypothetical protein